AAEDDWFGPAAECRSVLVIGDRSLLIRCLKLSPVRTASRTLPSDPQSGPTRKEPRERPRHARHGRRRRWTARWGQAAHWRGRAGVPLAGRGRGLLVHRTDHLAGARRLWRIRRAAFAG